MHWLANGPMSRQLWYTITVVMIAGAGSAGIGLYALRTMSAEAELLESKVVAPLATVGLFQAVGERIRSLEANSMSGLQQSAEALAAGDLTMRQLKPTAPLELHGCDELASLAQVVNASIARSESAVNANRAALETLQRMLDETRRVVVATERGARDIRAGSETFAGAFQLLLAGFNDA
jgi:methyl-accepting chemotaxis protein